MNGVLERLGVKKTIVGVVVPNSDAVRRRKSFKGAFSVDGSRSIQRLHKMDVREVGEMIHKNGGALVARQGWCPAMSRNETRCGTNELINTQELTRGGSGPDGTSVFDALGPNRSTVRLAVGATRADRIRVM